MEEQIKQLQIQLNNLESEYFKNNFTARQDFNKYSNFTTRLKVPHYSTLPSTCEVGEIAEQGGELNICSATNTWTVCGLQT